MTLLGMQARRYPSGEVEKKFSLSSFSKLAGYGLPPPLSGVGLGSVCPGFASCFLLLPHGSCWGLGVPLPGRSCLWDDPAQPCRPVL